MIGMAKSTRKTSKVGGSKTKDLSPSKVLAIVANWNNTSPNEESPRRKRPRDEKLPASVPRSRRQKKKDYLSSSADEDELPSFKAKPFYSAAKPKRYLSPFERKEERDRLIDAGVDPQTLNRSFEDLHGDRIRSRSIPRDMPGKEAQSVANVENSDSKTSLDTKKHVTEKKPPSSIGQKVSASIDRKTQQVQSARQRPEVRGEIKITLSETSPPGHIQRRNSSRKPKSSPVKRPEVKGEMKVILSESSPAGHVQRRNSPKKSSPTKNVQRRTSPRKQPQKPSATKGIQMYMKNLKNSQKKAKKPTGNQKAKKNQTTEIANKSKDRKPSKTTPKENKEENNQNASSNEKTARGLDFGASDVNGQDVAPLDRSFDQGEEEVNNAPEENGDFMDFLVFHDEDFRDDGRETEDFVQSLLMEIDEDLEEAEAIVKRSPRKRKMKTEQESMASPSPKKSQNRTPRRQRQSSTPLSSKKSSQPKLDDWLTLLGSQPKSSPNKKSAVQRSGIKGHTTELLTPESSGTTSPKASSPPKPTKLYPVFTPPTSPAARQNGTPSSRKKQSIMGKVNSPKESKRSPLLKSLKSKNDSLEQLTLDLGQKWFGAVTCHTCGTVYTAAHPGDEADHARFHKKYLSSIKFPGWKQEEVVEEFHDGRIIVVTQESPRFAEKKVDEIRELVDRELGFLEGNPIASRDLCKTYLFITSDKKVGGCLIAEQITKGYRVIVEDQRTEGALNESQKAWCCETESEPALCGVSRIWVPVGNRRKRIASRMVDCVRKNFMFGMILTPDDIAFSDPTPDGKIFATKYTGTPRFLVYKYR